MSLPERWIKIGGPLPAKGMRFRPRGKEYAILRIIYEPKEQITK
jgi:hypothetical protein